MERIRRRGRLFLLPLLLLAACTRPDDIAGPEEETPVLRSVVPAFNSVVIPAGESVTVPFTVTDADYAFNYGVTSSQCQVKLLSPGGKVPEEFCLKDVYPSGDKGTYTAVIADAGTGKNYDCTACIAIVVRSEKTGGESIVRSAEIQFKSEILPAGTVHTGLPVVYVDTEGARAVTSKTEYLPASVRVRGEGGYESQDTLACEIRGRGNTTWWWPKKPYLLKLQEREHMLGMRKHKRWVLLANFMDRTLMRNLVAMKVASLTSLAWSPSCVPVELVLNGKHQGSYLLIEQVRVDKHRVDITEMTPQDNDGDAVTGGYLLELDFHYDNEVQWVDPHGDNGQWGGQSGIPFGVKYPDSGDLTPQQLTFIKKYVYDTAEALYGPDFRDPEKGYAAWIDVDSFIDYWIVFEVMGNHELGNPGSVFFHKDRGGKLVAGPCWDFDWGVLSYRTSPHAKTGLVNGNAIWYARLFQDPDFKAKVKKRFQELLPELQKIPDYMDACEELLAASADLNFAMWNPAEDASQNGGHIINGDERMSFHDAVALLKNNFEERLTVIPKNL